MYRVADGRDAELSRRRPAVRHAWRSRVRARVPGRRRVQHQGVLGEPWQHGQLPPVRRGPRREARGAASTASASRSSIGTRHSSSNRGFGGFNGQLKTIDVRVPVTAGPHNVGVTFLATNYAPGLDMNRAFERSTIETGGLPGFTFYPHIGSVRIDGPYDATAPATRRAARRILSCTPAAARDEAAVRREDPRRRSRVGRSAARRRRRDIETLLAFYDQGRERGRLRGRHRDGRRSGCSPTRSSSTASSSEPAERRGRRDLSGSAISSSRRGCRSSSGAASRTTSC